jgi:hypothetical protein
LLLAHVLEGNGATENGNGDIVALAEDALELGNVEGETVTNELLGRLSVAAVDSAAGTAGVTTGVGVVGVGGGGNGESGERSEDDSLGEHLEGLLVGWLVWERRVKLESE